MGKLLPYPYSPLNQLFHKSGNLSIRPLTSKSIYTFQWMIIVVCAEVSYLPWMELVPPAIVQSRTKLQIKEIPKFDISIQALANGSRL